MNASMPVVPWSRSIGRDHPIRVVEGGATDDGGIPAEDEDKDGGETGQWGQ